MFELFSLIAALSLPTLQNSYSESTSQVRKLKKNDIEQRSQLYRLIIFKDINRNNSLERFCMWFFINHTPPRYRKPHKHVTFKTRTLLYRLRSTQKKYFIPRNTVRKLLEENPQYISRGIGKCNKRAEERLLGK